MKARTFDARRAGTRPADVPASFAPDTPGVDTPAAPLTLAVVIYVGESVRRQIPIAGPIRSWAYRLSREAVERIVEPLTRSAIDAATRIEGGGAVRDAVVYRDVAASAVIGLAWFAYCHDAFPSELAGYGAWQAALTRLDAGLRERGSLEGCRSVLGRRALLPSTAQWLGGIWKDSPERGDAPLRHSGVR